ncbi:cache domain-containing protein [Telmatospirillum sp.]|uniref:methyl-accepting chemotaxis protein n=1 Tax=Telmatospirillum sp. TaxID=2079197 RepID=UPI0028493737|nr:cache domain-containing protein [Telmatospirillum sp.]MDR3437719.1 cache domain-containing protein [Telmatospirillum sp.]
MKALKVRQQILLIPLLSVFVVCLVAVFAAAVVHEKIDEAHRLQLKSVTDAAVHVVQSFHAEVQAGRLDEAQAQTLARDALRTIRFAGDEYFYVYAYDGKLIVHPVQTDLEGTYKLKDTVDAAGLRTIDALIKAARAGGGYVPFLWPKPGETTPVAKLGYAAMFGPWEWVIGTGVYVDDVQTETTRVLWKIAAVGGGALVLVGLVGVMIANGIGRRVRVQADHMLALADGHLDAQGADDRGDDEISHMAQALEGFRHRMLENRDLTEAREAEQTRRAAEAERVASLAHDFDAAVSAALDVVAGAAGNLEKNATGMSSAAELTSDRSITVASAAQQASANVESVATATEGLTSSIGEIGRQVASSEEISAAAVSEAGRTSSHVQGLAEAAQRIGAVVKLINDIASQTNLLALNATIEAARAGEAGRGFAVVANEVKSLANETARATGEISEQVSAIQQATDVAVGAINGISQTIGTIRDSTTAIAAAVDQQNAATREITRNVHEASSGTAEVSRAIAEVTSAVTESRQVSGDVLGAAGQLRRECESLRSQVRQFLADVRAG